MIDAYWPLLAMGGVCIVAALCLWAVVAGGNRKGDK